MKNQLWKYWKGQCYQLLYCAKKKNCYSAECCLETIQGQGICSLILSPPTTGYLAAYLASPLGICHPRLKKGKGRGRGRKVRKGKGTLSPQFLPPFLASFISSAGKKNISFFFMNSVSANFDPELSKRRHVFFCGQGWKTLTNKLQSLMSVLYVLIHLGYC